MHTLRNSSVVHCRKKATGNSRRRSNSILVRLPIALSLLPILLFFFFSSCAVAGEITVRYAGSISFVKTTVINDITSASGVELTLVYDSDAVPSTGETTLAFDSLPATSLTIQIGPHTFEEHQDLDFGAGFPSAVFIDGELTAVNMVVVDAILDPPSDLDVRMNNMTLSNPVDGDVLRAVIDFSNPQVVTQQKVAVPFVPNLFLIGLALFTGFIGAKRGLVV